MSQRTPITSSPDDRDLPRLPWEIVETVPSCEPARIERWAAEVARARRPDDRVRALVGSALSTYWAVQTGVVDEPWPVVAERRGEAVDEALDLARTVGRPDLVAEALLGGLHARWGPDHIADRPAVVAELAGLHDDVTDEELRYQIRSWSVLEALDAGDHRGAAAVVDRLEIESRGTGLSLFPRRIRLWRANLAMLAGAVDEAVAANQAVLADTAPTTGAPFSFQNAMVTFAIERFFRRGLADVVDPVRSVRASSPRVGANWDAALAFSLASAGQLDEAAACFEPLAADDFSTVHRDLNWLVVVVLLGHTAHLLDDRPRAAVLRGMLTPFAGLDATHGSGYASYGPVGRVVGLLAAATGDVEAARRTLGRVLRHRSPGPWTSLARLDLARLGDPPTPEPGPDPLGAAGHAERAAAELQTLGLDVWASEARQLVRAEHRRGDRGPTARRRGATWSLVHASGEATVRHGRGVELLVALLARPGEVIDAVDLDGVDPGLPRGAVAESTLDEAGRRNFRARLARLERQGRPADRAEIEALRRALAGSTHVSSGSAEVERARVRVTKAIRRAIDAVTESSPDLGAHLAASVSTGRTCIYAPPDGRAWHTEALPADPD